MSSKVRFTVTLYAEQADKLDRRAVAVSIHDAIQRQHREEGLTSWDSPATVMSFAVEPDHCHATVDNLVSALADLGFGDDDAPVNGGDCVETIGEYWPRLVKFASTWPQPPRFAELRARIKVGTRVLSVAGEMSNTDEADDVHTGPNAIGTITAIDDDIEHGICLAFEPSGVSVLLSLAELAGALDLPGMYEIDPDCYRAAYWTDGQSSVRLTGEHQQDLPDADLLTAAQREANDNNVEIGDGEIVIGMWRD